MTLSSVNGVSIEESEILSGMGVISGHMNNEIRCHYVPMSLDMFLCAFLFLGLY